MSPAPSAAPADAPVVIVLGMHRSGTSLCASLLHAAGIDMLGDAQVLPTEANRRGHFERWDIVTAHRRILAAFGQAYDSLEALPPLWWRETRLAGPIGELAALVAAQRRKGRWGFKDPRTMRLFRLWRELLARAGLTYRLVLCLRQPWYVARSLATRDGLAMETGLALWLRYQVDFLANQADLPWLVVDYDDWFREPEPTLARLLGWAAPEPPPSPDACRELLARTLAPGLRRSSTPEAGPPTLLALYEAIRATGEPLPQARSGKRRLAASLRRACQAIAV